MPEHSDLFLMLKADKQALITGLAKAHTFVSKKELILSQARETSNLL